MKLNKCNECGSSHVEIRRDYIPSLDKTGSDMLYFAVCQDCGDEGTHEYSERNAALSWNYNNQ